MNFSKQSRTHVRDLPAISQEDIEISEKTIIEIDGGYLAVMIVCGLFSNSTSYMTVLRSVVQREANGKDYLVFDCKLVIAL